MNKLLHRVKISEFLNHWDFTWNQFWGFVKCKISHFTTYRGSEFRFSWFLYHSDFTWNQCWSFLKCKISHFTTFRDSECWVLWIFALFKGWHLPNEQNSKPLKWQKWQFFARLEATKFISRKISVIQKSWNFHTVRHIKLTSRFSFSYYRSQSTITRINWPKVELLWQWRFVNL